jgi:glycine cleavage system H protein
LADYDIPRNLRYSREDEWARAEGDRVTVGITDYAQQQLGDVVFVELPDVGRTLKQGESFGTIESVKAVSELFSPVSGEVTAVNPDLANHPESVNAKPHETWMIRLRPSQVTEADSLLDAAAYNNLIK